MCCRSFEGTAQLRVPKVVELDLGALEGQAVAGRLLVMPGDDDMAEWDNAVKSTC